MMADESPHRLHGGPPALIDPEAPCPVCDEPLGEMGERRICWVVTTTTEPIQRYGQRTTQDQALAHRDCAEEVLGDGEE